MNADILLRIFFSLFIAPITMAIAFVTFQVKFGKKKFIKASTILFIVFSLLFILGASPRFIGAWVGDLLIFTLVYIVLWIYGKIAKKKVSKKTVIWTGIVLLLLAGVSRLGATLQ